MLSAVKSQPNIKVKKLEWPKWHSLCKDLQYRYLGNNI